MDGITPGKTLGISEVASRLGCHEKTVYEMVRSGRLSRPRRQGNRNTWCEADIHIYQFRLLRGDFEELPPVDDTEPKDPG